LDVVRGIAGRRKIEQEAGSNPQQAVVSKPVVADPVVADLAAGPVKLLDNADLIRRVQHYGSVQDSDSLKDLLQEQFAFRYGIAISSALIYIERMFRYECGKLDAEVSRVAEELLKGHRSAVYLGYGTIREKLESKHPSESQGFERALRCLREVRAMEESDMTIGEKKIAHVSAA
jgi:hypothetical protein